jgi:parallel beta-helix repeat protein
MPGALAAGVAARWRRICAHPPTAGKRDGGTLDAIVGPAAIRSRPRGLIAAGILLVVLAGLVVAVLADRHEAPGGTAASGGPAAAAPPVARMGPAPRVTYAGPRGRLAGPVTLRAHVRDAGARVIAVTFTLDGRPLGTDTTAPYALDVDAGRLTPGPHRVRAEAVDRMGRRGTSRPASVRTGGPAAGTLVTSPGPALDAALAALARGGATVRLGPGRWTVGALSLGPGARLEGAGASTVLEPAGVSQSLVTVGGSGARIADLALDGVGRVERGVTVSGASDVRIQRVSIGGVREHGVAIWGPHAGVSVQDSRIEGAGAGGAGVLDVGSDRTRETSVVRTTIEGFRGYGIDFVQVRYGQPSAALHNLALDNRIADIQNPDVATGTSEGGIWSGGVEAGIVGNHIRNTGWDGIETVGSSRGVAIVDNDVSQTRVGIYLEHETNGSLVAGNDISRVVAGINSEWRYGGHGSAGNTIVGNRVVAPEQNGLFIDVAGDRNRIADNLVVDAGQAPIVLQGASGNVVTGNRACAGQAGPVVVLQSARYDNGVQANSLRNRLDRNTHTAACPGP